jgi:hypothetical protein
VGDSVPGLRAGGAGFLTPCFVVRTAPLGAFSFIASSDLWQKTHSSIRAWVLMLGAAAIVTVCALAITAVSPSYL